MPGELVHVGSAIQCPHGGQATIASANQRVKVSRMAVALVNDQTTVAACPFQIPGPTPHPCVKVQWLVPATRVKVMGQFVLLKDSGGVCLAADQAPQGKPAVTATQPRVKGM